MHDRRRDIITQEFQQIKASNGIRLTSEMKWKRADKKYMDAYKSAVDYFFSLLQANHIHFHCMIADCHKFKHKEHGDGKKETTISKMYYQMLKHRCCKYYGKKSLIHVRPDNGDCTSYLPQIHAGLNSDARNAFKLKHSPILSINPTDSSKEPLLQLNDIIIGGIASYHNERFLVPGAAQCKTDLAQHILNGFGWSDYSKETPWYAPKKITLWHYTLK